MRRPYRFSGTSFRAWYRGHRLARRSAPAVEWDDGAKEWFNEDRHTEQYPDGTNRTFPSVGAGCLFSFGPMKMSMFPGYEEAP